MFTYYCPFCHRIKGDEYCTNLNGDWYSDDGGYYYIKQIENKKINFKRFPAGEKEWALLISAFIDGRDYLHFKNNTLWWEHLDYKKPGEGVSNEQEEKMGKVNHLYTMINSYPWYPKWDGNISKPFNLKEAGLNLPKRYGIKELRVNQGRNSVNIVQYPSSVLNDYETIIEFNDNPTPYADWYSVVLHIIEKY